MELKNRRKHTLPLHRKYRPKKISDMIGNSALLDIILSYIENKNGRPSTYLLQGPRGCGKTTLSRIMAAEFGAKENDIYELNISHTGGKDTARSIADRAKYLPSDPASKAKVYILNECQRATVDFQNALLDPTEEPPDHVYFIFCTTEPQKLIDPLLSRCSLKDISVRLLTNKEIVRLLRRVSIKEGKKKIPPEVLNEIAFVSGGCPREALVSLGSIINIKSPKRMIEIVEKMNSSESNNVLKLAQQIWKGEKKNAVLKTLSSLEEDSESIRRGILGYMRSILMNPKSTGSTCARAIEIGSLFENNFWQSGDFGLTSAIILSLAAK